ncbi:MAG TPA: serine/threonine protein kinase, partial [Anaerolineae bacterium]|nr:serine/threonine protein kinase [Anaerolineae bacterium]
GQQIDQYRILRHIARGGMADVYLAEDVDLQRKVALKIMLGALAAGDPQFAERFRREAITVAKLDHPNIVQVYNVGQTPAGQPYIAMQYIEGGSLQDKLQELADRKKLLTTEQALNIARPIALALGAAHQAGIVHRDLKPANVLIRPDGTPVLVDLGIAAVQGGAKLTQTGSVIGTPAYMSPEQVRGAPLDGRADLYALGIMLYELLTGIRPFEADSSVAILHKQVYEEPLPVSSFRPDLSGQTLDIVTAALQKDPAHRYQSAAEMVQAIDQAIQAEGLSGPNPQATVVLTQMSDSKLLQRSHVIQASTAVKKKLPAFLWPIVALLVLTAAALAFSAFRIFTGKPANVNFAGTATAVALPQQAGVVTTPPVSWTATPTVASIATPTMPPTKTPTPVPTEMATETAVPPTLSPQIPRMWNAVFCATKCLDDNSNAITSLPAQSSQVFMRWEYENVPVGAAYTRTWLSNGEPWVIYNCAWDGPTNGIERIHLWDTEVGLRSGEWEVTVTINSKIVLQESITVQGSYNDFIPVSPLIQNKCH